MLESNSRTLLYYDALLTPHHEGTKHIPLEGILREVELKNHQEKFSVEVDKGQAAVRLSDIKLDLDKKQATLLVGYADSRGADPVFAHLEKGTLRSELKQDGEGVAISAHITFDLNRSLKTGNYPAIIEDVPGIGRTRLEPFLRRLMKNASSYLIKKKNGNEVNTWPTITFLTEQSSKLGDSLKKGGKLTGVEITKYAAIGGLDKLESVTVKNTTTSIKIEGKPTGDKAKKIINDIMNLAKSKEYYDMRVIWNQPKGGQKSVRLGTARQDAGDALFGTTKIIRTAEKMPQCSEEIIPELQELMLDALK